MPSQDSLGKEAKWVKKLPELLQKVIGDLCPTGCALQRQNLQQIPTSNPPTHFSTLQGRTKFVQAIISLHSYWDS